MTSEAHLPDDLHDALAARAAGEDLPGVDPAALDRRLAEDPGARALLEDLRHALRVVRQATPAASEMRRRTVIETAARRGKGPLRRLKGWPLAAAALVLILAGAGLLALRILKAPPAPSSPLDHLFSSVATIDPGERIGIEDLEAPRIAPRSPRFGGSGGGGRGRPLVPFAAQVDFKVLIPGRLPPRFALRVARVRRAAPPHVPTDTVWLEYRGDTGVLVLVERAAESVRDPRLAVPPLPDSWITAHRTRSGTSVTLFSPSFTREALDALADALRPIRD
jgi:hypothetical protein